MTNFRRLQKLSLSGNHLPILPSNSLMRFKKLVELNLQNNRIQDLQCELYYNIFLIFYANSNIKRRMMINVSYTRCCNELIAGSVA